MTNINPNKDMFDLKHRIERILYKECKGDMSIGVFRIKSFTDKDDASFECNIHVNRCAGGRDSIVGLVYNDDSELVISIPKSNSFNPWNNGNVMTMVKFPKFDHEGYDENCGNMLRDACTEPKLSKIQGKRPTYIIDERIVLDICGTMSRFGIKDFESIEMNMYEGCICIDVAYYPNTYNIKNERTFHYNLSNNMYSMSTPCNFIIDSTKNNVDSIDMSIHISKDLKSMIENDFGEYRNAVYDAECKCITEF